MIYNHGQQTTFVVLFWLASICYLGLLIFLVFNCYYYVYKEGRYKVFFILSFYIFSLLIAVSRFLNYAFLLVYVYDSEHNPETLLTAQNI